MSHGWTRFDIGRRLSWRDFHNFLAWLPPTDKSAWYRAKKPNSWWVTPELQFLAGILYALEGANWQRGGGVGTAPKPHRFPEDREFTVKNIEELEARRNRIRQRRTGKGE